MTAQDLAVIIPVYKNDPLDLIEKASVSILNQSYRDFKLFIAVDGPVNTDVTDYLKAIEQKDVQLFLYPENCGLAATLNKSIRQVKEMGYRYIARMDADDVSHTDRFTKQMAFFKLNKDVLALGTQAFIIDRQDTIIGVKNAQPDITYRVLRKRSDIIHPTAIFRADFFDLVGYYNETVSRAEDYDLWFRAAKKNTIIKSIPDRLYYFRYDKNIIERRKLAQKDIIKVKKKYISYFEYFYLVQHYIVWFLPGFLLKYMLFRSIREK